ncbi:MAG: immunity 53 family protein [Alphaproteobacteria bacterium]|nr:immunity 53 family protein [Alphaproteobacteria bacterium]
MTSDELTWLQRWYEDQCDGDWEHSFGVKIETLDNPGWSVDVDLTETDLEGVPFETIKIDRTEHDWIYCDLREGKFFAACGPQNLAEILRIFREWAAGCGGR